MPNQRKLRLDVQNLRVESFEPTARAAGERGTVFGQNETQQTNCYTYDHGCNYSYPYVCHTPAGTCYQSCVDTCYATCPGVSGCAPYEETQEPTCLGATCYWVHGAPYYDGNC